MDWTQQGNPERDLFEAALGGSHKCTLVRRSKSSEGGTRTSSVSRGKYRVGKLHAEKGVRNASISSITPTILATIWDDLCEAEQSNVNHVIVDYLQSQKSEIVDDQN